MSSGLLHLLSLLAATGGMFAFALVNDGHWRQLFAARAHTSSVRATGRGAGAAILALSFWLCALANPISMALLTWPMLLALAAAFVAAFLTLQSRYAAKRGAA